VHRHKDPRQALTPDVAPALDQTSTQRWRPCPQTCTCCPSLCTLPTVLDPNQLWVQLSSPSPSFHLLPVPSNCCKQERNLLQGAHTVTQKSGFSIFSSPTTYRRRKLASPRATNTITNQPGNGGGLSDTSHLNVDLLSEGSFLQLKSPFGICYFGIGHELDIQHFFLALRLLQRGNGGQSSRVCSWSKTGCSGEAQHIFGLTRMPASRSASATPMSASLWTAAVWVFPRELR